MLTECFFGQLCAVLQCNLFLSIIAISDAQQPQGHVTNKIGKEFVCILMLVVAHAGRHVTEGHVQFEDMCYSSRVPACAPSREIHKMMLHRWHTVCHAAVQIRVDSLACERCSAAGRYTLAGLALPHGSVCMSEFCFASGAILMLLASITVAALSCLAVWCTTGVRWQAVWK